MSEFYEATNRNAQSCNFGGNATVNGNAPASITGANAAASSCLTNPSATFTPSAPSGNPPGPGSSSGGSSQGGTNSGAVSNGAWMGLGLATLLSVVAGVVTVVA